MMKWNWIASGSIVVMLAYFVVDNHVDLYPWNNLTTSQLPSTLAALIPFGVYATAFALGVRWLMLVGTVHSYVWLALQIRQWWIPYLFGPTALHRDFGWYFANGYDRTIKILPEIDDRPIPDAQHLVLQARPRSPCSVVRSEP
ncbi:MAG: hypothetical protein ACXU71_13130 [Croceibacterium sp.]